MARQTSINEHLKMYKISDKVINFITKAMENCRVELAAGGQMLTEIKIWRLIFQGDSFVITITNSKDDIQLYTEEMHRVLYI